MTAEIIILEARIRQELFQLQKIAGELKAVLKPYKQKPVKDTTVLRALGSILHDFYSGIEKIFLQIAKEIDQSAPRAENWHRLLLEQMTQVFEDGVNVAGSDWRLAGEKPGRHPGNSCRGGRLKWLLSPAPC